MYIGDGEESCSYPHSCGRGAFCVYFVIHRVANLCSGVWGFFVSRIFSFVAWYRIDLIILIIGQIRFELLEQESLQPLQPLPRVHS